MASANLLILNRSNISFIVNQRQTKTVLRPIVNNTKFSSSSDISSIVKQLKTLSSFDVSSIVNQVNQFNWRPIVPIQWKPNDY